jgi:curved DNA-binding protein CbpA
VAMAEEEEGGARPYEVLGLDEAATQAEVRRAYRRLSLLLHPDKNRGHEELARRYAADLRLAPQTSR